MHDLPLLRFVEVTRESKVDFTYHNGREAGETPISKWSAAEGGPGLIATGGRIFAFRVAGASQIKRSPGCPRDSSDSDRMRFQESAAGPRRPAAHLHP